MPHPGDRVKITHHAYKDRIAVVIDYQHNYLIVETDDVMKTHMLLFPDEYEEIDE